MEASSGNKLNTGNQTFYLAGMSPSIGEQATLPFVPNLEGVVKLIIQYTCLITEQIASNVVTALE